VKQGGEAKVNKRGETFAVASLDKGLYHMKLNIEKGNVSEAWMMENCPKNDMVLWHQRLGHLNETDVRKLANGAATGIHVKKTDEGTFCEACAFEKSAKLPFKREKETTELELFDVVGADLAGPFQEEISQRAIYYSQIVEMKTRRREVVLLRKKSDETQHFKDYYQKILTQTGKRIKKFICDNGGEYKSNDFKVWAKSVGMEIQYTMPYMLGITLRTSSTASYPNHRGKTC
jgi:hypothetical protein